MKKTIQVEKTEPLIGLASNIVYTQKDYWCNASARQLSLSFMAPRQYFPYDVKGTWPLIVFICGGGFQKMDRNVWLAELAWFAKHGYAVASVDYSVLAYTKWPEPVQEVKEAIRFLRAHAAEFKIDPTRVAVMGESAGGYLSAFLGVSSGMAEYEAGGNLNESSAVQAAVPWYPPARLNEVGRESSLRVDVSNYVDPATLVTKDTPPFLILHGTADDQVAHTEGEHLYEAFEKAGAEADLYLIEGANHGDIHFVQPQVKQIILEYLDKHLK